MHEFVNVSIPIMCWSYIFRFCQDVSSQPYLVDKLGKTWGDQPQVSSLYALWTVCKNLNTVCFCFFNCKQLPASYLGIPPECTWETGLTQFATVLVDFVEAHLKHKGLLALQLEECLCFWKLSSSGTLTGLSAEQKRTQETGPLCVSGIQFLTRGRPDTPTC